jgi:dTDP-4-dehydrorhamnose 3,5-epimerase
MPIRRDSQMVTRDGRPVGRLPAGVQLHELVTHADERGTVCELYDLRWGIQADPMVFAYLFTIRPGLAKGWGIHREHHDRYAFLDGELELALYDERQDSPTSGLVATHVLSARNRQLLTIPPGVWHAERNIGSSDVIVVNFPTIPYDHSNPDKYRLPLDTEELPVELTRSWRGW